MQHNRATVDFIDQPRRPMPHLTVRAIVLAIALATIPAAASSYFGLFAGIVTIASANPSAVVSVAVPPRRATASWNNILQTGGSAGT